MRKNLKLILSVSFPEPHRILVFGRPVLSARKPKRYLRHFQFFLLVLMIQGLTLSQRVLYMIGRKKP